MRELLVLGALRATWLLGAVGVAAWLLRRKSAALRAAVWGAAMVAILAMPLLPRLDIPVNASTVDALPAAIQTVVEPAERHVELPSVVTAPKASPSHAGFSWELVFGIGAVVVAFGKAASGNRVRRILRDAQPGTSELSRSIAAEYGLRRAPEVLLTKTETVPFTVGVRRPRIVLPLSAVERQEVILRHETAHIARGDWPLLVAAQIAGALFWYHPLVWLAIGRLRFETEQAADDLALAHRCAPSDYANELLSWGRGTSAPMAVLPMVRRSGLSKRLRRVLDSQADRRRVSVRSRLAVLLAALGLTCAVPVLHAEAQGLASGEKGGSLSDLPKPVKLKVLRVVSFDGGKGQAWDLQGNPLSAEGLREFEDVETLPASLRKEGQRWVGVTFESDKWVDDVEKRPFIQMRFRSKKGSLGASINSEPTNENGRNVFTKWITPTPDVTSALANVDITYGQFAPSKVWTPVQSEFEVLAGVPQEVREYYPEGNEGLQFVRFPKASISERGWLYKCEAIWSNGEVGEANRLRVTVKTVFQGFKRVPGEHIVKVRIMRRPRVFATIPNIPMYPNGGGR